MKKKSIAFIVASFLAFNIFANDFFKIDVGFEFGFANGTISEYVFNSPIPGTDYMLSRLDWDLDFVKFFGLSVDAVFYKYFYVGLSGRIGIPGPSGRMQDYDWMNVRVNGEEKPWYDEHYWLTNYSNHDNYLTKYLDGTIKLGGMIYLPMNFRILPSVSFQVQEYSFDGRNGYRQYVCNSLEEEKAMIAAYGYIQEWNDKIAKTHLSGKVISYDQQRIFIFLGVKVFTTLFSKFYLETEVKFSPFTSIGAIDNHHLTNYDFLDQPSGLGTWSISGKFEYTFGAMFRAGMSFDYMYVPLLRGATYEKYSSANSWSKISDIGCGASSSVFSFSITGAVFF